MRAKPDPARLEKWRATAGRGMPERFKRRLEWEGLDEAKASALLGEAEFAEINELPAWTARFEQLLAARGGDPGLKEKDAPLGFEDVWLAWAEDSASRIPQGPLSPEARRQLRRKILEQLCDLAFSALKLEFDVARSFSGAGFEALLRRASGESSTERYDAFVRGLDLSVFFKEYSALARLMTTACENMESSCAEIIQRFERDWPGETIAELKLGKSDSHDNGRRVAILLLASGKKLVYKPRGAKLCAAWDELCGWLNEQGAPLPLRRREVRAGDGYGWLEFIPQRPCKDEAEVGRYYRRMGHLLALFHVLRVRDMHFENIVSDGEHPVPIDVEVLLQGDPLNYEADKADPIRMESMRRFSDSVFATGLLPFQVGEEERDISAIGGAMDFPAIIRPVWRALNTDEMGLESAALEKPLAESRVELDGQQVSSFERRGDMLGGFREMAAFLARVAPKAHSAPAFTALRAQPARLVLRATAVYGKLLHLSMQPEFLREGVDRSLELEALTATWTASEVSRPMWPIALEELAELERMDVPIFFAEPDGREIVSGSGKRAPFYESTGVEMSARSWAGLSKEQEEQASIVERALLRAAKQDNDTGTYGLDWSKKAPFDSKDALERAALIAADIEKRAVRCEGGLYWIEPCYTPASMKLQLGVLPDNLYSGTAGLAFFLGEAAKRLGEPRWKELARLTLKPAARSVREDAVRYARAMGPGFGVGCGGMLAAFMAADMHDEARLLASCMDEDMAKHDTSLDFIGGSAGAVIPLLELGEKERAARFGARLLEAERKVHSGYAHGLSGMAVALHALGLRDGVKACFDAEETLYSPETGQWQRGDGAAGPGAPGISWCWGSPGMAIARAETGADPSRQLAATMACPERWMDHLCCGNFGMIRAVRKAGRKEEARSYAAQLLARTDGISFRLAHGSPPAPVTPSFFGGTAGIGYELLALSR